VTSTPVELVRDALAALERADFDALALAFAPQARWRAVEDGPWNCEGRTAILDMMRRHMPAGAGGTVAAVEPLGDRLIVGFRPDPDRGIGERPLDDGLAYIVVTVADGVIVELKGCADHTQAQAYASAA
jgi:ketosteroid isomerase-like protein